MRATASYHPHKPADKARRARDRDLENQLESEQAVDDICLLMAEDWGRRLAWDLLRQGLCLPGQQVSSTNGSLQSYQLGRHEALEPFDDLIRSHCNEQWKLMLQENTEQDDRGPDE